MILTYNKTYTMTHTHNNRHCTTFSENIINLNKIFLFDTHKHTITRTNRGAQVEIFKIILIPIQLLVIEFLNTQKQCHSLSAYTPTHTY